MVVIALLSAAWVKRGAAVSQKAASPMSQDKLALGEPEVKQLLHLVDTGKNGKISKLWRKHQ
jgi:hypothetical protein